MRIIRVEIYIILIINILNLSITTIDIDIGFPDFLFLSSSITFKLIVN